MKSFIDGVLIWELQTFTDDRGSLTELFRNDRLLSEHKPEMAYLSWTKEGVTRGPHQHKDQTDLFVFLQEFKLYLIKDYNPYDMGPAAYGEVFYFYKPTAVLVPPGVIHAYQNLCDHAAAVINFPNRLYGGPGKQYPVDETRYESDALLKKFMERLDEESLTSSHSGYQPKS